MAGHYDPSACSPTSISSSFAPPPSPLERRESISTMLRRQLRDSHHFQSAALGDKFSPLQVERQKWEPVLPSILRRPVCIKHIDENNDEEFKKKHDLFVSKNSKEDMDKLSQLFPSTWSTKFVRFAAYEDCNAWVTHPPIRMGVVLSGGQAPGGHNVISGVYDYVKQCNPNSQLFGFLGGPQGIFSHTYMEISDDFMNLFRNQGGFDMIRSGRHKIETPEQKQMSMNICKKLDLHGLVVIGGDDSNTNAAILAEYFLANNCSTRVIGCPKTIDGDLKNEFVETSFGFDTAVKTYSEFIGNLCIDVLTSGKYYHFIRLMGRSASNIALECALQTRPNLIFIGEEVQEKNISLRAIVTETVDMIVKRHQMGKDYGVILIPEGLIEFIPEMGQLIKEVNNMVAGGEFEREKLSEKNREVFDELPKSIRQQLLLDRDPHGNVQVAMIATERLLILMVEAELEKRGLKNDIPFAPQSHYFGYEGRCGMPSNFDANYCYALGNVAAALVDNNVTGCMAIVNDLHKPSSEWIPAGCPLTIMMNIENRKGKDVPVIKKYLVELDNVLFKLFDECREEWKYVDYYRSPGSIQFEGPVADVVNYTILPPRKNDLLPPKNTQNDKGRAVKSESQMSALEMERLNARVPINPILTSIRACAVPGNKTQFMDADTKKAVLKHFPLQCNRSGHLLQNVCECDGSAYNTTMGGNNSNSSSSSGSSTNYTCKKTPLKVGVVLAGQQTPGSNNILCALFERVNLTGGELLGFKGAGGLWNKEYIRIDKEVLSLYRNQGGFELLGRTPQYESLIATPQYIQHIQNTCTDLNLDGLVMIGGRWTLTDSAILAETFMKNDVKTKVVAVPATQNNNIDHNFVECTLGFDTASKCVSHLIGNLLTDTASATKYWYFIRLTGRDKSHMVLESSLQSHPNCTLVSELYAAQDKSLKDVVVVIADVINARSEAGKNFGAVLIPEGLLSELMEMRQLINELNKVLANIYIDENGEEISKDYDSNNSNNNTKGDSSSCSHPNNDKKELLIKELVYLDTSSNVYSSQLSAWSLSLLKSLPEFIRAQLVQPRRLGRLQLSSIATEELLSKLVGDELANRKKEGLYKGTFLPVCFYFGYQARSSLPSQFDCSLGLSHGYLAGICIESGLTGYATSMRGLCGPPASWRPYAFPITSILKIQPEEMYALKVPMVPSQMVKLDGKALRKVMSASAMWEREDRFCNPGPLQFYGNAMHFYNRYLFEQQHEYLKMLGEINDHLTNLSRIATFGVDELTLRTTCLTLEVLKKILAVQRKEDEKDTEDLQDAYTAQMAFLNHVQ